MFEFFDMLGTYEQRKVANDVVNKAEIDTCSVTDNPEWPYETAVCHPDFNNKKWIIVEQYKTKEEAEKEHQRWKVKLKKTPSELKDVSTCEICQMINSLGGEANKTYKKNE